MEIKGECGFTLLELLMVICIAGILSGFAYLGQDLIYRAQIASITRQLHADIQSARINAITMGKGYGIRFESPTTYVLFQFNDCNNNFTYDDDSCNGNAREETNPIRITIPSSVLLSKPNSSNDFYNDLLIFDTFGHPRRKNWGMAMMTIIVRHKKDVGIIRCISISMSRIRESIWNGSACI
jgi:prepilin-type N-terminal cleavage/methylation domain-containing protein